MRIFLLFISYLLTVTDETIYAKYSLDDKYLELLQLDEECNVESLLRFTLTVNEYPTTSL
jgi:hypothetical protein